MSKVRSIFLILLVTLSSMSLLHAEVINNIDIAEVQAELEGEGVTGFIHGAVPAYGHFVFTYRDKNNFFNHLEFSLVPRSDEARKVMANLRRHDKVKIQGRFSSRNPSAFKHIYADKIEVVKKYESDVATPPYQHQLKFPEELKDKEFFIGKIHAITYDNKVLVAEYKDTVLPLYTESTDLIAHLYRNDTVKVYFKIIPPRGRRPMHLEIDDTVANPITVLAPIAQGHATPITLSGQLVMFPQSPQIMFNVFAIRVIDDFGVARNYTLINFDDSELFKKLREKLQSVWDANVSTRIGGRNMWLNPKVTLTVSGLKNVVSPVQANPQIIVERLGDIEVQVTE